jgi:hypothetical protein
MNPINPIPPLTQALLGAVIEVDVKYENSF